MQIFAAQPGWVVTFINGDGEITRAASIVAWFEVPPPPPGVFGPIHPILNGLPPTQAIPMVLEHNQRGLIPVYHAFGEGEVGWEIQPAGWTPESNRDEHPIPPPAVTFELTSSEAAAIAAASAASLDPLAAAVGVGSFIVGAQGLARNATLSTTQTNRYIAANAAFPNDLSL